MDKREAWSARVAEWRASGQGLADFCRGKGFTPGGLRYWVKRLEASDEAPTAVASKSVRIARVVRSRRGVSERTRAKGPSASRPPSLSPDAVMVEVGTMRVYVPATLETARLEALLGALVRVSKEVES